MKRSVMVTIFSAILISLLGCKKVDAVNIVKDKDIDKRVETVKNMKIDDELISKNKVIYLAGGCFWGVERYFAEINGVIATDVGYANSKSPNPTYKDVVAGGVDASETVRVVYNPKVVSLPFILDMYSRIIDPTSVNKQGNDRGRQYRTGIYFTDENDKKLVEKFIVKLQKNYKEKIAIEYIKLENYYLAEEYHQDYLIKNPNGYCHIGKDKFNEAKNAKDETMKNDNESREYIKPPEAELKKSLTDMQYKVAVEAGTERAFENEYWDNKREGIYVDILTGEPLFSSTDKYDSGTGWPSFTKPIDKGSIKEDTDFKVGYPRTEAKSVSGDTHLGHIFNDGPTNKGGMRYCINSASLKFIAKEDMEKEGYGEYLKLLK